ncbi:ABC-F family ATP-binding cassette domain-containing protein [Agromyces sp. MMS24-K17]|uniref:ABC-F family ATP-binding cassette domain-containing protein n=1 Tax=Agromyces sp. MMS24-K17 TaxID=3372850 RepID=UPI003754B0B4
MSSSATPSITLRDLSFAWPDGRVALSQVSGTFGVGRTSLIGDNGAGKSTLLRLIAGRLEPSSGSITTTGEVGYLRQTLILDGSATVAELLGIDAQLRALRAIEAGDVDVRHFDAIGDDWDIESRAADALHELGFPSLGLDRRVEALSGGEAMLIAITGLRVRRTPITLLDEPTNNLDRETRAKVAALVASWPGTLVVVSHDRDLLELVDETAELHDGRLTVFGGPFSAWREHLDREQQAAIQAARSAEQALKVERRQREEAEVKLARRERTGRSTKQQGGIPRILAGNRASRAQVSAGGLRAGADARVQAARAAVDAASSRVRTEEHVHLVLPDPEVPRSRRLAELYGHERGFVLQGPERVALVGPNGIGKTTLLDQLVHGTEPTPGRPYGRLITDRVGYLTQRLDGLDDERSALENVAHRAAGLSPGEIRNQLARLLLRGDSVERPVSTLSGGERFRVALAGLLLAEPPAQLLVLDEPTNNLDLRTVDQLVDALADYRGALLVVTHDRDFLERAGFDTLLELDAAGELHERPVPRGPGADQ